MRKRQHFLIAFSLVFFPFHAFGASHPSPAPGFVVFESPGAVGTLDSQKLQECLERIAREMKLAENELPRIVIYHISPETGRYLGVNTNSNWRVEGAGPLRYEMWIIDKPSNFLLAYMLENVLEHHFQMHMDDASRSSLVGRVQRGLDATVDVKSFR